MLSTAIAVSSSSLLSLSDMSANSTAVIFMPILPCLCLKEHENAINRVWTTYLKVKACTSKKRDKVNKWCSKLMLSKYIQIRVYLHRITRTTMQTATSTSTITITATPASRPVDELAPGSVGPPPPELVDKLAAGLVDVLPPELVDKLAAGLVDVLPPELVDKLAAGLADVLVPGSVCVLAPGLMVESAAGLIGVLASGIVNVLAPG